MKRIEIDKNIKGLIFDCDGTLVDSMPLHMEAWEFAFNQFAADYKHDFLNSLRGMKETAIIDLYNKTFGTYLDSMAMVEAKHIYFQEHIRDLKPLTPVTEIVEKYYCLLPLAVVSGSTRKVVHQELQIIGLFDKFDSIITADDPIKPKPAPDKFLETTRRINVQPVDCCVFEDGDPGIEAAKAAGMKVVDVRPYL